MIKRLLKGGLNKIELNRKKPAIGIRNRREIDQFPR